MLLARCGDPHRSFRVTHWVDTFVLVFRTATLLGWCRDSGARHTPLRIEEKKNLRFIRAVECSFAKLTIVRRFQLFLLLLIGFELFSQAAIAESAVAVEVVVPRPFKIQGIYVRQQTAENERKAQALISNSLEVGINTLVVDLWTPRAKYEKAIERIQNTGLHYVPRITMFPEGGTARQIRSRAYWEKKYKLVEYALDLGAKDIQLDYIRYNSKTKASSQNAIDIREVLRFFSKRIHKRKARLQIDVFGEVAHRPSLHIGQDMKLFAGEIDAVCPMVYPSHYLPYKERSQMPFETVFDSLTALKKQLGKNEVDVLAYIELFNHRFPMTLPERVTYIEAQLKAVRDSGAEGWLAWSAGNHYDLLFEILRRLPRQRSKA